MQGLLLQLLLMAPLMETKTRPWKPANESPPVEKTSLCQKRATSPSHLSSKGSSLNGATDESEKSARFAPNNPGNLGPGPLKVLATFEVEDYWGPEDTPLIANSMTVLIIDATQRRRTDWDFLRCNSFSIALARYASVPLHSVS